MDWSKRKFLKNNWVWLSIVTVPIVAVIVGLMAFDLISQGVVTANNRSGSMPQELVEPMSKNPALVASQETPVDRLFRFGTYVSFRSAFGDQQGWIHGFSFDNAYQDWIYDIHTAEGVVFNNVFQVHVIRERLLLGLILGLTLITSPTFCATHPMRVSVWTSITTA